MNKTILELIQLEKEKLSNLLDHLDRTIAGQEADLTNLKDRRDRVRLQIKDLGEVER